MSKEPSSKSTLPPEPWMSPFMALTFYSIAMIAGPIVVFFLCKSLPELLNITDDGNIYGAVAAVVTVHVVLIAFIIRAYKEEKSVSKVSEKKD